MKTCVICRKEKYSNVQYDNRKKILKCSGCGVQKLRHIVNSSSWFNTWWSTVLSTQLFVSVQSIIKHLIFMQITKFAKTSHVHLKKVSCPVDSKRINQRKILCCLVQIRLYFIFFNCYNFGAKVMLTLSIIQLNYYKYKKNTKKNIFFCLCVSYQDDYQMKKSNFCHIFFTFYYDTATVLLKVVDHSVFYDNPYLQRNLSQNKSYAVPCVKYALPLSPEYQSETIIYKWHLHKPAAGAFIRQVNWHIPQPHEPG